MAERDVGHEVDDVGPSVIVIAQPLSSVGEATLEEYDEDASDDEEQGAHLPIPRAELAEERKCDEGPAEHDGIDGIPKKSARHWDGWILRLAGRDGLNAPARLRMRAMSTWAGRLFLGDAWLLYAGPIAATTPHAHHAFQLVRALDGEIVLRANGGGGSAACHAAVIPHDVEHVIESGCVRAVLLYVDPDTMVGRTIRRRVAAGRAADTWRASGEPLANVEILALPVTWLDAAQIRAALVSALVGATERPLALHPALLHARRFIETHVESVIRLETVAGAVGLSEDRLSHLFSEELGISFRRFVLWMRLQRAARELAGGHTLAKAAAEAGFADGAHLTRTFRSMFGIAPSEVAGFAKWVVAPRAT